MRLLARLTRRSETVDKPTTNANNASAFRGVQVVTGADGCCQAAIAITGKRYLAHQIPRLPLERCDAANCHCSYELYDDRRTDLRRASDVGYDIASEIRAAENRRALAGRRKNDV